MTGKRKRYSAEFKAKVALDALPIEWDLGENAAVQQATIDARLDEGLTAAEAFVGNSQGDARAAIAAAPRRIEATYAYPFQNHAPMAPMNATVVWTPTRCARMSRRWRRRRRRPVWTRGIWCSPAVRTTHSRPVSPARCHPGGAASAR